jgi:hypothetical protein
MYVPEFPVEPVEYTRRGYGMMIEDDVWSEVVISLNREEE